MMGIEWLRPAAFLGSILYALIGVVIFWLCFWLIDKVTPADLWAEIVEKQNRALAMVVAAMCLGISIIVAAAIHWRPGPVNACTTIAGLPCAPRCGPLTA